MSGELWMGIATDVATILILMGMVAFTIKLVSELIQGFYEP